MFKRCLIVLSSPLAANYRLMAEILEGVNEIRSLSTDCLMLIQWCQSFFFFSVTSYKLLMEISWDLVAEISFKTTGNDFTLAQATGNSHHHLLQSCCESKAFSGLILSCAE